MPSFSTSKVPAAPAPTTFRPSCVVRLQMRLDEGSATGPLQAKLERKPPKGAALGRQTMATTTSQRQALEKNAEKRKALAVRRPGLTTEDFRLQLSELDRERAELQFPTGGGDSNKPLSLQDTAHDEELNVIFEILPLKVAIQRNGIRDASTCEIEFDHRDIPIDPRSVRSCLVSVTIGTVEQIDFEAGVLRQATRDDGSLRSLVEHVPGQETLLHSTTQFVGYVDEWDIHMGAEGDAVRLQCRDVSAILRDQKVQPGFAINLSLPIAIGVQEFINLYPSARGMSVFFGTPVDGEVLTVEIDLDAQGPTPSDLRPLKTFAEKKPGSAKGPTLKQSLAITNRSRNQERAIAAVEGRMQAWDHIVSVVEKLGLIPIVRGFSLYIIEPRTLFASVANAKRMVYGRNVEELEFARKMGGVKVPSIEVRCPDPEIGRERWARYPVAPGELRNGIFGITDPAVSRANNISPNGQPSEEYQVYPVRGIKDGNVLERIAASTYEQIGRQEIEGSFSTCEITSFQSPDEADLLSMYPGEAIELLIVPSQPGQAANAADIGGSSFQELSSMSAARRRDFLRSKGISAKNAQRLANAQEIVPLANTFRAGHVNIKWDASDGVELAMDFHNFIVIREQPAAAGGTGGARSMSDAVAAVGR